MVPWGAGALRDEVDEKHWCSRITWSRMVRLPSCYYRAEATGLLRVVPIFSVPRYLHQTWPLILPLATESVVLSWVEGT